MKNKLQALETLKKAFVLFGSVFGILWTEWKRSNLMITSFQNMSLSSFRILQQSST